MADALGRQATIDPLTGLYNLRHMASRLESLLEHSTTLGKQLALIVVDMDRFKLTNDTYGHATGDMVLRAVADEMRSWAGSEYTCWRLGGDEFAIALPGLDAAAAAVEGRRLERAIHNLSESALSGQVRAGASIGIAIFPEDGDSVAELLGSADRRMYENKALRGAQAPAGAAAA